LSGWIGLTLVPGVPQLCTGVSIVRRCVIETFEFAGAPTAGVRSRVESVLLVSGVIIALAYVASAVPAVTPRTLAAANFATSSMAVHSTQLEAPVAALAEAPSRGPLRVYFMQPVPYENGLPVFRGYVHNEHVTRLSNLRMEITYADGAVVTYPIAVALAPSEQITFEFRTTRADLPRQPKFFFSMSR
jgi:hypothetical protein